MREITAPHLEEQAIERYIRRAVGPARTPALRATRTIQLRGRIYVLLRRMDGEAVAVYREERNGRLKLVERPPRTLLVWDGVTAGRSA
jgi:hypothetical protein